MRKNRIPLAVESLEDRCTPSYATLGEGVSHLATSAPRAQSNLVHVTQNLAAQNGLLFGQVVAFTAHNPSTFPG